MRVENSRLLVLALCAFSLGTWIGYYWRKSLGVQPSTFARKRAQSWDGQVIRTIDESTQAKQVNRPSAQGLSGSDELCVPQHNVMFLKTHKTASSAVQNVLRRYSEKHDLTVGFSNTFDIRFHYGQKFQASFVTSASKPINMIFHHMIFNLPEVQKVMPKDTSAYVTILREPGSLFESMFDYFQSNTKSFGRIKHDQPNALEQWLDHAHTYFHGQKDGMFWWFAKNGMFFDLGYDSLNEDDIYIQGAVSELDNAFDLVLLSDYFSESMLLLKDHLCWSMEDVLVLKMNARDSQGHLTDRVRDKIRQWNKADAAIYDHFNRTFWEKVAKYGNERMQRDLKTLNKMNSQLQADCVVGEAVSNKDIKDKVNRMYNPRGTQMQGYNIRESAKNNATCINLLMGEIQWTRLKVAKLKAMSQKDVKLESN